MNQIASLNSIPTNIITGFLGVGKTTAILSLLKTKPANERWAVLVNEFGEIGVDGSLVLGEHNESKEVYIREVPGGCMCCTAGLPMQIALTQLITKSRPHRLLIEPTGLGHPKEVLETLNEHHNQNLLSVQKVITMVDARKLRESRYTVHETFNQQIDIADIVVGNKQDLYEKDDFDKLKLYVQDHFSNNAEVVFTQQGQLPIELLYGATANPTPHVHQEHKHKHHHHQQEPANLNDTPIPSSGFVKAVNQGEGFKSIGWRFDAAKTFSRDKLCSFLHGIVAERVKAVFITADGIFGYNATRDALTEIALDECFESRIEIIATKLNEQWEEDLLACMNQ